MVWFAARFRLAFSSCLVVPRIVTQELLIPPFLLNFLVFILTRSKNQNRWQTQSLPKRHVDTPVKTGSNRQPACAPDYGTSDWLFMQNKKMIGLFAFSAVFGIIGAGTGETENRCIGCQAALCSGSVRVCSATDHALIFEHLLRELHQWYSEVYRDFRHCQCRP